MQNHFTYQNPTRVSFGKDALMQLPLELSPFGKTILLVYGGGSIHHTGLYAQIRKVLYQEGKTVLELGGVPSNPTAAKVYEGIALAKEQHPDFILAVGGGSVIDCAKAIAAGACTNRDFWQTFYLDKEEPAEAIPIGVILTMVGTGSEMNGNSVITHEETKRKNGAYGECLYPRFALLNPKLTYTVPKNQMVSGICDIISHILEVTVSPPDTDNVSDDLAEAILKSVIRNARIAVQDPEDYTARSNLMWAATLALNGLLECSKGQDWEVHQIEHQIGAYTHCPHGQGLAAISAAYYRAICPYAVPRFYRLAINVWGIDPTGKSDEETALAGIDALEQFFREIGACTSLRELGMTDASVLKEIASSCYCLPSGYHPLTDKDVLTILKQSF